MEGKENIQRVFGGLNTDSSYVDQPKNTSRFVLNGVMENDEGDFGFLGNEESNEYSCEFREGYIPIGKVTISDNETVIFLTFPGVPIGPMNTDIIGIKKGDDFEEIVVTGVLDFNVEHQIDAVYRLRRGCERTIYFTDGYNPPRMFNIDKPHLFKTGGNWDADKFKLFKQYASIPTFDSIEITEEGNLLPGSYNAAIQYVDENMNTSEWITTSDPILIYNSKYRSKFHEIRGSVNRKNGIQDFGQTGKAIKFVFGNLDQDYPYYRVAIIEANNGSGQVSKVTCSDLITTQQENYVYTGTNPILLTENEILEVKSIIETAQHIEQIDNRLLLANTKGKQVNYCKFQKYASQIKAEGVSKTIDLKDIDFVGNQKRGTVFYDNSVGYQPGELYSFGIVYVFADGSQTPAYHIPGDWFDPGNLPFDPPSGKPYEGVGDFRMVNHNDYLTDPHPDTTNRITDTYTNPANCDFDYWGYDANGLPLEGQPIRHHRFPSRKTAGIDWITKTVTPMQELVVCAYNNSTTTDHHCEYSIDYELDGVPGTIGPFTFDIPMNPDIGHGPALKECRVHLITDQVLDTVIVGVTLPTAGDVPQVGTLDTGDPAVTRTLGDITWTAEIRDNTTQLYDRNITSTVMGIVFYNIVQPEEFEDEVIGYYIVRNERTNDQKTILDTVAIRPMTVEERFVGYSTQLIDGPITGTESDEYFAFISQEHLFHNYEMTSIDEIEIIDHRITLSLAVGTDDAGFSTNEITEDVMAGTSYDPEVAKKTTTGDYDGFDLQIFSWLLGNVYENNAGTTTDDIDEVFYLNALSSKVIGTQEIYNVSSDNKIGVLKIPTDGAVISPMITGSVRWGICKKINANAYANFRTLPYYKESKDIQLFTDPVEQHYDMYHGDTFVSSMNYTSTCYYNTDLADREIKRGLWKTILGAAMIVVGAALTIVGAIFSWTGIGLAGVALGPAVIKFGVSTLKSGITEKKLAKAYLEDYDAGLRNSMEDARVSLISTLNNPDDVIQFYNYTIKDLFMESTVNANLRVGTAGIIVDFLNSLNDNISTSDMNQYMLEKLTTLDEQQNDGRLFQGYPGAEFYDINPDYERGNKQKVFFHLSMEYDCCSCSEEFPHRIHYSEQSFQEELIDNYRIFLANNYRDIQGETGDITDLFTIQNNLFIHTEQSLFALPQNIQERITGDIVTFLGTGEYFNIPPRKITDTYNASAGTRHKWATVKTEYGVFFVSDMAKKIYLFNGNELKEISNIGMYNWFKKNIPLRANQQYILDNDNRQFEFLNNTSNPFGVGFIATYDVNKQRVIFTKKDFIYEQMRSGDYRFLYYDGKYYVFLDYQTTIDTYLATPGYDVTFWGVYQNNLRFIMVDVETLVVTIVDEPFTELIDFDMYNSSWTLSYSLKTNTWTSFHSYLPSFYSSDNDNFYSWIPDDHYMWKHNKLGHYQSFYHTRYPFTVEYVSLSTPIMTRIWNYIIFQTTARRYDVDYEQFYDENDVTFNKGIFYNSRQCSGELSLEVKNTKVNPENYLFQQLTNAIDTVTIDKNEKNWSINDFRDLVFDYTKPMFNSVIQDIQGDYFTDKIVNTSVINVNKNWSDIEKFRDKYLVIRLIFDNFETVKLIFNYSLENEIPSFR